MTTPADAWDQIREYATRAWRAPQRITFEHHSDHVDLSGSGDSLRDISTALQQLLVEIEAQLSRQASQAEDGPCEP